MARELIEPHSGDTRHVLRKDGEFTGKQVDVGRPLTADRHAQTRA